MWRHELGTNEERVYKPKDALNGKNATFDLHSFMYKVMKLRSDASMYMGSATTPPCQGIFFSKF